MKKVRKFLSYVLVALAASMVTMALTDNQEPRTYSKLDQLEELIQERFIGEADKTAMEDAAAAAMVDSLGERWSFYIPASEYAAHVEQMNNAYVGIGITIQAAEDGSGLEVIKVNEGGPAEEAGMQAGDLIVEIEGYSMQDMSAAEARELVRGEPGTRVIMVVLRDETRITMDITRKTVKTVVASGKMLQNDIGLVTIANFDSRCASETIAAIETLLEQGARALVFDVRNNPGGYKHELVKVLDYLLPEGPLFRSEDYTGAVLVDESDAKYLDIPMVVLVNENSYSAAEFFAAALWEYDAASVVGTQTCGKGYFQTTIELLDGSAVGLSVGKYSTPNGVSLAEAGGLTPDLTVEVDEETAFAIYAGTIDVDADSQLQAALDILNRE